MKKNFYTYALLLTLLVPNAVFAEHIDLSEINLKTEQSYYPSENVMAINDTLGTTSDIILPSVKIEDKKEKFQEKAKGVFSFLNPISDLLKIDRTISGGVKKLNEVIDNKVDKLGGTPLNGLKKLDDVLDKGVEEIDGAVGTTLEGVDKMTVEGAATVRKVLKTGIQKETV